MLPLHQRCSHETLWLYDEKQSSCVKNWLTIGEKKCREKTLHQNNRQRITIASYGNRTHVNSMEGYSANTTPTMLTWTLVKIQGVTVLFCQKLIDDLRAKCRERTQHQNIYWRMTIASYGSRTHVNSLEGYYATTTPTMLTWNCDYTMRNSPLASNTDWQSERKSVERKRCTKTIAKESQLHRTGIEPMSIAWKATMLPLHQRCSHETLWLYDEKQSSCVKNWLTIGEKKCRENAAPNNRQRITIASYENRTHVNSLEGYYANTTPTMLTWTLVKIQGVTVLFCQKLIDDLRAKCRERTQHQNIHWRMTIASYGNRTHVNSFEGYYATTTPTMLTWTLVKIQGVTVLFCQKLIDDLRAKCRERTQHQNIYWRMAIASYGNRTHVNSLEGYYATTTPTMLTWNFVIIRWETVLLRQKLIDNRREKV